MKLLVLFGALAEIAAAQCGSSGKLAFNPITGALGCTGKATITTGTIGNLPAAGNSGNIYLPTDTAYDLLRDNGVSWAYYMKGRTVTPVNTASFSWLNQGGASETAQTNGMVMMSAPAGAGNSLRIRAAATPATPFTKTFRFTCTNVGGQFSQCGVCFYESGTTKAICLGLGSSSNNVGALINKYTNLTTYTATYTSIPTGTFQGMTPILVRIGDDGTNLTWEFSGDNGFTWVLFLSSARNNFFTTAPDKYGYMAESNNGSNISTITVFSID